MRQQGKCLVCKQTMKTEEGWHIHHLVKKAHGGTDLLDNIVLLHPNCHRQVHSKGLVVEKPASTWQGEALE